MSFEAIDKFGDRCVSIFHRLTLFAIGAATGWSAAANMIDIATAKSHASIQDLLLLANSDEKQLALTRHMIDLVTEVGQHMLEIAVIGGTTLMLSISVYVIRMASHQFPSKTPIEIG